MRIHKAFACASAITVAALAAGRLNAATPSPSPSPSPTPNPYRSLVFASQSLDGGNEHGVEVTRGFAAVKRDGTAVVACVSFKNTSNKVMRRVEFEFPIEGRNGGTVGTMNLDRNGEFSPNVSIEGWRDVSDWQSGMGHRGYNDNCAQLKRNMAAAPLLRAASVSYRVVRVEF
ncbi:MAG TPA: hypothetical protein VGF18_04645, partial [Candidatus Tumulicola sp.]